MGLGGVSGFHVKSCCFVWLGGALGGGGGLRQVSQLQSKPGWVQV